MAGFLLRRVLQALPVLLLASLLVFLLTQVLPGDATQTILGEFGTPEQQALARAQHGLDLPLWRQYLDWLVRCLGGDFGRSLHSGERVSEMLLARLPVTLELSLLALAVAVLVGVPAGVLAARRRGSWLDALVNAASAAALAMPYFWLGILLILLFAIGLKWLPPSGYVPFWEDPAANLKLMLLPAATISAHVAALVARQARASVLDEMNKDYVRTARAKGMDESAVAWRHVLRNALTPVITVLGLQLGAMLSGAIVTETVFSLPGLGRLIVDAVSARDYPVVQGGIIVVVLLVMLSSLLADLAYAWADPRMKSSLAGGRGA